MIVFKSVLQSLTWVSLLQEICRICKAELPGPREPAKVDLGKSDWELFDAAVADGWGDEFPDVPGLPRGGHFRLGSGKVWVLRRGKFYGDWIW